jgi:transposase
MPSRTLSFIPAGLVTDKVDTASTAVVIHAHPEATFAICPSCNRPSTRIHSRYRRRLADFPWQGRTAVIEVRARRFRCASSDCERRVFTERLPTITGVKARRTVRLRDVQRTLGLALGGDPGSHLAARLAMPLSGDTLLRLIRSGDLPRHPPPRVVGIDDWSLRRGRSYGTIVCDLERRRIIDLLPDRTAETVARWLDQHPGVEVVARDRAGAYAEGARQGAPNAIQVADHWHLLRNLGDTLQELVDRHRRQVHAAARGVAHRRHAERIVASPPELTQEQALRSRRRKQRDERFAAMRELKGRGLTSIQIAANLGISHLTVQRWLKAGAAPGHEKPLQPGSIGSHASYLEQRWQQGCRNATLLWRELKERGYPGSERTLRRWTAERRQSGARHREVVDSVAAEAWKIPSSRRCARLLAGTADRVGARESEFLAHLRVTAPDLIQAGEIASAFAATVCERAPEKADATLAAWMGTARESLLASFTRGLERDGSAVQAALTEPWSTGPVEGHINRLKLLKRQMYGRAKLDLLHRRLIQAA